MSELIASHEWHTRARVRIVKEVTSRSVDPYTVHTFHPGDELEMFQWGRAGRPVDRSAWWTSYDIDGAHIIDASNVEVITIIEELSPESED